MLLPGTVLPLHIFEPRYRAMIEDALKGGKIFGMIQPFTPQNDNRGPQPDAGNMAAGFIQSRMCRTPSRSGRSCRTAGSFSSSKASTDFVFSEELELQRGYRRGQS